MAEDPGGANESAGAVQQFKKRYIRFPPEDFIGLYLLPKGQVHWALTDFMGLIFRSQHKRKLRAHAREKYASAEDEHRLLWPGIDIPMSNVDGIRTSLWVSNPSEDSFWGDAVAKPTSLVMSYLCSAIRKSERMIQDKHYAMNSLKQLLIILCSASGEMEITVRGLGCFYRKQTKIHMDGTISNGPESLMSLEIASTLEPAWNALRRSNQYVYLTSLFAEMHIWELVNFCLDPALTTDVIGVDPSYLVGFGLEIFAVLSNLLDANALTMCQLHQSTPKDRLTQFRNKRAYNTATFAIHARSAMSLWDGLRAKSDLDNDDDCDSYHRKTSFTVSKNLKDAADNDVFQFCKRCAATYWMRALAELCSSNTLTVYFDGSSIGKTLVELFWLFDQFKQAGAYGPPVVVPRIILETLDGSSALRPQISPKDSTAFLAILRALNHVLWTMCRKTLMHWVPDPTDRLKPGDGKLVVGQDVKLSPLSSIPILRFVIDEEKSQVMGLLYYIQILGATAMIDHDVSHTLWNCYKRSITRSKLSMQVLKATICCNFNHGSMDSGAKLVEKREALRHYLAQQPPAYFERLNEFICFDRQIRHLPPNGIAAALQDFLGSKSIYARCEFVKNKRWFAIHRALRQLVFDFTVQREALKALLIYWTGQDFWKTLRPSRK